VTTSELIPGTARPALRAIAATRVGGARGPCGGPGARNPTAYFLTDGVPSAIAYVAAAGLPVIALIAGPVLHRPLSARPWHLLAAGQAAFFIGDATWFSAEIAGGEMPYPSMADLFYIAAYPLLVAGIGLFIWRRGTGARVAPLVDALAVGVAGAVLLWAGSIEGFVHDTTIPLLEKAALIAYPVGDAVLLGGAAYLVLGGPACRARQLLVLALTLLLGADVLYSGMLIDVGYERSWVDGLWLLSYLLLGLTALLPSMRGLTDPARVRTTANRNLFVIGAALGAVPISAAIQVATAGQVNLEVIVAAEAVLGALLLIRAHDLTGAQLRQERRFATLVANASDAFTLIAPDGTISYSSPAADRVLLGPHATAGMAIGDVRPMTGDVPWAEWLADVFATPGVTSTAEFRREAADGSHHWLEVTATNRTNDGEVGGVVLNYHDTSDAHEARHTLARLKLAIDQASESVIVADADARIEYVNPAFERITGYSRDEVIGENPRILNSGRQPASFYQAMWATLVSGQPWVADFTNRRKDGTTFEAASIISPLHEANGALSGYVSVTRDVTGERRMEARAAQAARERALIAETIRGISAREAPEVTAEAICRQVASLRDVLTAGLFVFELDGQAAPYGFAIGGRPSSPMRRVPRRRTEYLKSQAARGPWIEAWRDLPWHPYNEVFTGIGVEAIAYAPVRDEDRVIGFLHISAGGAHAEELLSDAMPALVEFAEIAGTLIAPGVAERSEVELVQRRMREIIGDHRFSAAFQPIVDLRRDEIVGYEGLTRFDDGVSPDVRFAEADAVQVGPQLELAALRTILADAAGLPAGVWLNLNVSPDLVLAGADLRDLLAGSERDIVLEVTEHAAIDDYVAFRAAVAALGPKVRIAVDDAGAGFASLRHILELRPAFVKLDRALIAGIDTDEARQALVAGMHHFAGGARCSLIAEGVETAFELAALRELDVILGQGYLLGRPSSISEVLAARGTA
jgi:PAS domain S-box-containing protein